MAFSGCSTKTIAKIKPIEIPEKYLQSCEYKPFKSSKKAELSARSGDFKLIYIELSEYSLSLMQEIDRCDRNALNARVYQSKMKEQANSND